MTGFHLIKVDDIDYLQSIINNIIDSYRENKIIYENYINYFYRYSMYDMYYILRQYIISYDECLNKIISIIKNRIKYLEKYISNNNKLDFNLFILDEIKFNNSLQNINNELYDLEHNISELYSNNNINNHIILTNYK